MNDQYYPDEYAEPRRESTFLQFVKLFLNRKSKKKRKDSDSSSSSDDEKSKKRRRSQRALRVPPNNVQLPPPGVGIPPPGVRLPMSNIGYPPPGVGLPMSNIRYPPPGVRPNTIVYPPQVIGPSNIGYPPQVIRPSNIGYSPPRAGPITTQQNPFTYLGSVYNSMPYGSQHSVPSMLSNYSNSVPCSPTFSQNNGSLPIQIPYLNSKSYSQHSIIQTPSCCSQSQPHSNILSYHLRNPPGISIENGSTANMQFMNKTNMLGNQIPMSSRISRGESRSPSISSSNFGYIGSTYQVPHENKGIRLTTINSEKDYLPNITKTPVWPTNCEDTSKVKLRINCKLKSKNILTRQWQELECQRSALDITRVSKLITMLLRNEIGINPQLYQLITDKDVIMKWSNLIGDYTIQNGSMLRLRRRTKPGRIASDKQKKQILSES